MTDDNALEIVKGWDWGYYDPDGFMHQKNICLSDVVNKLAMEGVVNPPHTLLELLASGHLIAEGTWLWHAYRLTEHYQHESNGIIPNARWKYALDVVETLDTLPRRVSYDPQVNLKEVGQGMTDKFYWNWRNNEFAIADADTLFVHGMDEYHEEWFAAREIQVCLSYIWWEDFDPRLCEHDAAISPKQLIAVSKNLVPTQGKNKGGRPPSYDWEQAVAAIVFKWSDDGNWQPASQADIVRALGDWFGARNDVPSDSLLKLRAKWLYPLFEQRKTGG